MYNVSIPEISNEELLARYSHIKPIVTANGGKYFLREFAEDELRKLAYDGDLKDNITEQVDMDDYFFHESRDFECIHKYGYYGFFKPSIAEVLAQIPERDIQLVDAFEIILQFDSSHNQIVFDNGYHMSKVRLYTRKDNPRVHRVRG